ncbi:MAG TPA: riboflavin synthase [Steroidobacteraceae bacterium]|jgi:riboflavin synthase|nr:riboflavin synthase [Steroidobacteraceae bacterium]
MFTGIVQDTGTVASLTAQGGDVRLKIRVGRLDLSKTAVGDSICVQGCCVTAVALSADTFEADLSRETLGLTTLGDLALGAAVNLEPALRAGDALGGHLVSGHVDGVAKLTSRSADARSTRMVFEAPAALARFIARKGSVALNGVSLTVNEVEGVQFGVNLIPHTLEVTTLGELVPGACVNLEIDQVARYVERLASFDNAMLKA